MMSSSPLKCALVAMGLMLIGFASPRADLPSEVKLVVLRVSFPDIATGNRFNDSTAQTYFNNIAQLWRSISYKNISISYQFTSPYQLIDSKTGMAQMSTPYVSGDTSTLAQLKLLIDDAVANSPQTIDWSDVYGVVVLFSDTRSNGFYRGVTYPTSIKISPPSGTPRSKEVFAAVVGENPGESCKGDVNRTWGRWAHEIGHELQANKGNPWHPSNYNSDFEQMDREYPAQSGVFEKQSHIAFPNWLPTDRYLEVRPPGGAANIGLLAEERLPSNPPLYQAIKAFLPTGGTQKYYLISLRERMFGDELAKCTNGTMMSGGIPDQGVLIERVVEGGDTDTPLKDCDSAGNCSFRWVDVKYNGALNKLWHGGETYSNTTDGIFISIRNFIDSTTSEAIVDVRYSDIAGQPDLGINSWLAPPGNTYETTDIWIDSPVNGYGTYRQPMVPDLMGGMVPMGNGDDPAVGLVNRLYARVRNYGSAPAANVVVHFDITDPPGVGIAGANGFVELGTVTSAKFPGLASIPPGGSVDVYLEWTPKILLTQQQIMEGRFAFHTCIRVRLDHVAGETFFANQDGNGQQENIEYFQASSQGSPGAPGAPNEGVVHLRNDNPVASKQFAIGLLRETLPESWEVQINNGNPIVNLRPGELADIPVVVTQTEPDEIGKQYSFRIVATSQMTLSNEQRPDDVHNEMHPLGGVQMQVSVLRKTAIECQTVGFGRIQGRLIGAETEKRPFGVLLSVLVVGVDAQGNFIPDQVVEGVVQRDGSLTAAFPSGQPVPRRAVCLFAGTTEDTNSGSTIFPLLK
jgi:hypothetical protein